MQLHVLEPTLRGLSDAAGLALLTFLDADQERFVLGVADVTFERLRSTRFGWAATHVLGELAAAPGCTFDPYAGLLICWHALDTSGAAPMRALNRGRRLGAIRASFVDEAARRIRPALIRDAVIAFDRGFAEGRAKAPVSATPRAPAGSSADGFETELRAAKLLEHGLRGELEAPDLGSKVTAAERGLYVRALGASVRPDDIDAALRGRATACRRRPLWRGESTADRFLRLTWLLAEHERITEALAEPDEGAASTPSVARTGDVVAIDGHEVVSSPVNPEPPAAVQPPEYSPDLVANLARLSGRTG